MVAVPWQQEHYYQEVGGYTDATAVPDAMHGAGGMGQQPAGKQPPVVSAELQSPGSVAARMALTRTAPMTSQHAHDEIAPILLLPDPQSPCLRACSAMTQQVLPPLCRRSRRSPCCP